MLLDYAVTDMGWFDDYSDAEQRERTMRGNGITIFLLYVAQCITFNQTKLVTVKLISEDWLKSLYSRLGFKVIKDYMTSPNFEEARKQFNYELGKSKSLQIQNIGLKRYLTIPQRITILHNNQIDLNENRDVFKYLNKVPPSVDWLLYEYIDAR